MADNLKIGQVVKVEEFHGAYFKATILNISGDDITVREDGTNRSEIFPRHRVKSF